MVVGTVFSSDRRRLSGWPALPGSKVAGDASGRPRLDTVPAAAPTGRRGGTLDPDDEIRSTPLRLAQLERQLGDALERADQQASHLRDRRRRIEDKEDRAELVVEDRTSLDPGATYINAARKKKAGTHVKQTTCTVQSS